MKYYLITDWHARRLPWWKRLFNWMTTESNSTKTQCKSRFARSVNEVPLNQVNYGQDFANAQLHIEDAAGEE